MSTTHQHHSKRHQRGQLHARRGALPAPPYSLRSPLPPAHDRAGSPPLDGARGTGGTSRPPGALPTAAFTPAAGRSAAADGLPFGRTTFLRGFVYAWRGVVYALRTQRNARVHAAIAMAAVALGIGLKISPVEFALIFVAIASVFISEMINTVVEACVDLVTTEFHPLARVAKDVAAGAVLLNALLSIVIGLFVFVPHLWPLLLRWVGH